MGRCTAGSRCMLSLTRACSTGRMVYRPSSPILLRAQSAAPRSSSCVVTSTSMACGNSVLWRILTVLRHGTGCGQGQRSPDLREQKRHRTKQGSRARLPRKELLPWGARCLPVDDVGRGDVVQAGLAEPCLREILNLLDGHKSGPQRIGNGRGKSGPHVGVVTTHLAARRARPPPRSIRRRGARTPRRGAETFRRPSDHRHRFHRLPEAPTCS